MYLAGTKATRIICYLKTKEMMTLNPVAVLHVVLRLDQLTALSLEINGNLIFLQSN